MSKTLERYLAGRAKAQEDVEKVSEKCPFCGAERSTDYPDYDCDTYKSQLGRPGDYGRSEACKDRQIAAQAEEIVKLKKVLLFCRKFIIEANKYVPGGEPCLKAIDAFPISNPAS